MSGEDIDTFAANLTDRLPTKINKWDYSSFVACRLSGKEYRYDESDDDYLCFDPNEDDGDSSTEPTDDDDDDDDRNVPERKRERDNTDEDTVRPDPIPIPEPSPPPITNPDPDTDPDRIPRPVPSPDPTSNPPSIPRRRLPSLERPENDDDDDNALLVFQNSVIGVEADSFSRTYNCLLHNPITSSPLVFRQCESNNSGDDDFSPTEDAKKFFEYLIRKTAQTGVEQSLVAGCVLTLNLLPTRIIRYAPNGQLAFVFGCNLLTNIASDFLFDSANAKQSIDGNAHINVKYVECNPSSDDVPDLTKGLEPKFDDTGECFVPVRNFKTNEPEQLGMKRQLQVIYEANITEGEGDEATTKKVEKQITIPSPLPTESDDIDAETLDTEAIKDVFPETLKFGEVKVEMSIIPYGYVRFYADEEDIEEESSGDSFVDDFFDDILTLIDGTEVTTTIDGEEVRTSRRYSTRKRNIITGEFTRKKAFLFEWQQGNGNPPLCQTFKLT